MDYLQHLDLVEQEKVVILHHHQGNLEREVVEATVITEVHLEVVEVQVVFMLLKIK